MDVALIIDFLVPGARYRGAFQENTQAEFDLIVWEDDRTPPTWDQIVANEAAALARYEDTRVKSEVELLSDILQRRGVIDTDDKDAVMKRKL